jgi:hypothetical protein
MQKQKQLERCNRENGDLELICLPILQQLAKDLTALAPLDP